MYAHLASYIEIDANSQTNASRNQKDHTYTKSFKSDKHNLDDDPIEINTATIEQLQSIPGIGPSRSNGILKYRELKGGFSSLDQLDEVYSLREEPALLQEIKRHLSLEVRQVQDLINPSEGSPNALLDINSASAEQLIAIRGIGPIYAKRILQHRDRLRGYSTLDQLQEIYGLGQRPEDIALISPQLIIGPIITPGIDINTADWQILVDHPYIDSKVAKSIIAMREVHGRYHEVADIQRSKLISDELYNRIRPHLTVGSR